MNSNRAIALAGILLLAACTDEIAVPTPPVVVAGRDLDTELTDRVALVASAADSDGRLERFEWSLVVMPDDSKATVQPRTAMGEVAELLPGGTSGLYVVSVVAVDDDGLRSEPDFINVLLRPISRLVVELACEQGCTSEAGAPLAVEGGALDIRARVTQGSAESIEWSATLARDPADPLTDAPVLVPDGEVLSVTVPRVARAATLTLVAKARGAGGAEAVGRLNVRIPDSLDEPPELTTVRVHQAGQTAEITPSTVVLPGDALHIVAEARDPNGEPVDCSYTWDPDSPVHLVAGEDTCRLTVFPLGGALNFTVQARTARSPADGEPVRREIAVSGFALESGGPSVRSVSIDGAGLAVGAGEAGAFYVWSNGARRQFSTSNPGRPDGAAAMIVAQPSPTGLIGWASSGEWSRIDLATGVAGAALQVAGPTPPTSTRAMAAGTGGRVFAATDEGLLAFDPFGGMEQWRPGLPDLRAVAVQRLTNGQGRVWYANTAGVFQLPSESATSWPAGGSGTAVTTVTGGVTTALGLSASTRDVWIGTGGSSDPGETGAGLQLYAEALDPGGAPPTMNAAAIFFTQEKGIRSIAVEESGPYAGDAWIIAGDKLFRVSRAVQHDGTRGSVPLALGNVLGPAGARSVAVRPGATRQVVVGTSQGLAGAPGLP